MSSSDDNEELLLSRESIQVNALEVPLRREQQRLHQQNSRLAAQERRKTEFLDEYDLSDANAPSTIVCEEALDLRLWCSHGSWTHCANCLKLSMKKLLPSFRRRSVPALDRACKCGGQKYVVPNADDVPLVLRNLTKEEIRILRPLDIHCGDYHRMVHGYRQRTGPFRITWCTLLVEEKIDNLEDTVRKNKVRLAYEYLMNNQESSYKKFVLMQSRGIATPFLYELFSAPQYHGIECALWPTLYLTTSMCESIIEGQSNRASGKESFLHKVLSSVEDFSLDFELVQYQFDRWLFKTITGAVNSSRRFGCNPNVALQEKSFSCAFWQWQHLYLLDAVRQYGFPSFFITISPYEWTFPWPSFIEEIRQEQSLGPTDLPTLETLHIAHILEQIARGYITGGNCNRWRQHIFADTTEPRNRNVLAYFYRFEFQQRGTVHLHMLVWLQNITVIRADLLKASIPWTNADDAFLVADTQKSDKSCLAVHMGEDAFIQSANGANSLQFHYTEEEAKRNLRAYITTLLGSLLCRSDVQVADGKAMLLKYVTSYVTKMHEACTSEGFYSSDVTGYQAAHSFLRTVRPLAPEMIFQLSSIKPAWTNKMTKQFRAPYPDQEMENKSYEKYLTREPDKENMCLLQWLRRHTIVRNRVRSLDNDKYLVGVKFVSVFNAVFFHQHLLVHHPHRHPSELRHLEEHTMPSSIRHFAQAVTLQPEKWSTPEQVRSQFEQEGHRSSFLTTIVAYVLALHDILHLWRLRVVDGRIGTLHSISIQQLYPLSPHQTAILQDIIQSIEERQSFVDDRNTRESSSSNQWSKYRLLLGKPGTGKSQVLIPAIHHMIQEEYTALLAAPVALLAQAYRTIFGPDLDTDTIHAAFHIPINEEASQEMNFALNKYDVLIIDEASLVSPRTFSRIASTLNRLNCRPVVIIAGDKCQQQPLQTVEGRVCNTTSVLNDSTFNSQNSIKYTLYQQFRILDSNYASFIDFIRHMQPSQEQIDNFQENIVLYPTGPIDNQCIFEAFNKSSNTTIMTVSRAAAQRVNEVVVDRLFHGQMPLTTIPCTSFLPSTPIYPYRGMKIVITENRDKSSRIVNGQEATVVSSHRNTLVIQFPDQQKAFVYPVTHQVEQEGQVTSYPITPAYARTISKCQGQNIRHLLVWLDSLLVPAGLAYVALSRVRRKQDISILQPMKSSQVTPVKT